MPPKDAARQLLLHFSMSKLRVLPDFSFSRAASKLRGSFPVGVQPLLSSSLPGFAAWPCESCWFVLLPRRGTINTAGSKSGARMGDTGFRPAAASACQVSHPACQRRSQPPRSACRRRGVTADRARGRAAWRGGLQRVPTGHHVAILVFSAINLAGMAVIQGLITVSGSKGWGGGSSRAGDAGAARMTAFPSAVS